MAGGLLILQMKKIKILSVQVYIGALTDLLVRSTEWNDLAIRELDYTVLFLKSRQSAGRNGHQYNDSRKKMGLRQYGRVKNKWQCVWMKKSLYYSLLDNPLNCL